MSRLQRGLSNLNSGASATGGFSRMGSMSQSGMDRNGNNKGFEDLDGPIVRITSLDTPVPFSPPLEHYFLPKVEDVVREARKLHAY